MAVEWIDPFTDRARVREQARLLRKVVGRPADDAFAERLASGAKRAVFEYLTFSKQQETGLVKRLGKVDGILFEVFEASTPVRTLVPHRSGATSVRRTRAH